MSNSPGEVSSFQQSNPKTTAKNPLKPTMTSPKILVFSASLRKQSFNRRLSAVAASRLRAQSASVTELNLSEYLLPIYDAEIEERVGIPAAAKALHEQLRGHDAVFIASPEYNSSIPPLLANLLTWVSRVTTHGGMASAFGRPVFAIGSASPGGLGGYRSLMALRQMLEIGFFAKVIPAMVSVAAATEAFDAAGDLINVRSSEMLDHVVAELMHSSRAEVSA
jgi:chromate reductase